jgi:hypothetical protein
MFNNITSIEELNRQRTDMLADPDLTDVRIAEINMEFSTRRRQIPLLQRGRNAVLMPFRVITHRVSDPGIAADAIFNPDAMLLTVLEPPRSPFIRDTSRIPVHNRVDVTIRDHENPIVVYSSFS